MASLASVTPTSPLAEAHAIDVPSGSKSTESICSLGPVRTIARAEEEGLEMSQSAILPLSAPAINYVGRGGDIEHLE